MSKSQIVLLTLCLGLVSSAKAQDVIPTATPSVTKAKTESSKPAAIAPGVAIPIAVPAALTSQSVDSKAIKNDSKPAEVPQGDPNHGKPDPRQLILQGFTDGDELMMTSSEVLNAENGVATPNLNLGGGSLAGAQNGKPGQGKSGDSSDKHQMVIKGKIDDGKTPKGPSSKTS